MSKIKTSRSDVIWNYVGTAVSMASGFVLLPLLMLFLTSEELGLWYVYVAIANLVMLFEFGFNPTFARNIVYVVSGARRLSAEGCDSSFIAKGIDWHLLNVVIRTSKLVYAAIAFIALVLLATIGSAYIAYISTGIEDAVVWISWTFFCTAIVLNLYFLYSTTVLRGYGDVAGENQARTFAKLAQLAVSGVLLACGVGLVGASVGYLINAVLLRVLAIVKVRSHREIEAGRASDEARVERDEIVGVLKAVSHLAWRDGVVQLALYASTQAMTIMGSLYLSLAETGMYSILLQLATAVCNLGTAYPKSFFPAMQAAFVSREHEQQRNIASSGVVAYWCLAVFGTVVVCVIVLPLLPLFKPEVTVDYTLFLGLAAYMTLLQQHSIFCNYIISTNEIPYMAGYLIAAFLGIGLVYILCGILGLGAWGILLGQAVSQIVYNNWKWPMYFCAKIGTTYRALLRDGAKCWAAHLFAKRCC